MENSDGSTAIKVLLLMLCIILYSTSYSTIFEHIAMVHFRNDFGTETDRISQRDTVAVSSTEDLSI